MDKKTKKMTRQELHEYIVDQRNRILRIKRAARATCPNLEEGLDDFERSHRVFVWLLSLGVIEDVGGEYYRLTEKANIRLVSSS